jgi:hypothetical protein
VWPFQELHGDEVAPVLLAHLVDGDDARVAHGAGGPGLAEEALDALAAGLAAQGGGQGELLEGQSPSHARVQRLPDHVVGAGDLAHQNVTAQGEFAGVALWAGAGSGGGGSASVVSMVSWQSRVSGPESAQPRRRPGPGPFIGRFRPMLHVLSQDLCQAACGAAR